MKKISVFSCVYNESQTVEEVYRSVSALFEGPLREYGYEHIFLDNSSTDNTLPVLKQIAARDKRVKILSYAKNFGPIKSEFVGYIHASGDAVVGFEANLKDPAELIVEFVKKWEEGYDVVYGVRRKTSDNFLLGFMRRLFYRLCTLISVEPIPENSGVFRLVDRKVVNELIKLDDYKPYIRGLITSIGFRQIGINYHRLPRPKGKGKSKSSLPYLIDFAINGFVSYSVILIRFCTYIGIFLSLLSFLLGIAYTVIKLFFWQIQAPGIATVIILILFFSGVQLFFLGVIGEYVGAIHSQVRKKPFVIIREKVNFE